MGKKKGLLKLTLLLTSMMTMMAGAVVAPSLPQIKNVFIDTENIELLSRLVITLPAFFIAIFAPFFGYLTDRLGRKKLLLASLVLYSMSGISGYFLNDIFYILIGRAFLGISVGGIMTIATTLVGDYFKGEERHGFAGLQGAFVGFGGVVFISLAGWFADIHWQMPFLIYLFAVPVAILGILFLYEPKRVLESKETAKEGIEYNRKLAVIVYLLAFTGIVFFYMIPVQIPFLLGKFENISNAKIGYAISLTTLSAAMVSINYRFIKKNLSFRQIFQVAMLFMGIGYFIISQAPNYAIILCGTAVSGLGVGLLMPNGNLWIMSIAPEKIRGTLVGRLSMFVFIGMFFSPVIIQPIINNINVSGAFLVASISMGVIAILLFALKSKM